MHPINISNFLSSTLFLFVICGVTTAQHHCQHVNRLQSPDNATFTIVGFFSINIESASPDVNAIMESEVMRYTIQLFNKQFGRNIIGYTMFDTCAPDDFDVTTEAVLQLLLGKLHKNRIGAVEGRECSCFNITTDELNRVIGIIGPSYSTKVAQVNMLLSNRRLPMVSYLSTSIELVDSDYYPHLYRTIPNDLFQQRFIKDVLRTFNWTYISILNSDETYGRSGAHALSMNRELCICLQKSVPFPISDDVIVPILKKLKNNTDCNVIILWGYFSFVQSILMKAFKYGVRNKTWIVSEESGTNEWFTSKENALEGNILIVYPNGGIWRQFEDHFFNITYTNSHGNPWIQKFFQIHGINTTHNRDISMSDFKHLFSRTWIVSYARDAVQTYLKAFEEYSMKNAGCDLANDSCDPPPIANHNSFSEEFIQHITFKGLLDENIRFDQNGDIEEGHYNLLLVSKHKSEPFQKIGTWNSKVGFELNQKSLAYLTTNSRCSGDCSPGLYPVYDRYKKCCWKCVECPKDQVKPFTGLNQCVKCPSDHLPNNNKTKCVAYIKNHIVHNTSNGYIVYAVSSISLLLILLTFVTYIVKKKTPIVRASNFIPSLLQLIVHLLVCLLPYLYFDEDTILKCTFRCFGAGVLFTLIAGITLAKVIHISNVFKLKLRTNQREVIQLYSIEIIIVIISLALEIFLIIAVLQIKPIEMKYIHDVTTKKDYVYCDYEFHRQAQFVYGILLQGVCFVKGFRARKLPEAYNETSFIAFAMLFAVLIAGISIPLVNSFTNPKDKKVVILLIMLVANLSLFLIMYSYKVILICKHSKLCCFRNKKINDKRARNVVSGTINYTMDVVKEKSKV